MHRRGRGFGRGRGHHHPHHHGHHHHHHHGHHHPGAGAFVAGAALGATAAALSRASRPPPRRVVQQTVVVNTAVPGSGVIHVGKHLGPGPYKKVILPFDNLQVSNVPVNQQDRSWRDRFNVSIVGRELTVWRVDGGPPTWAQELKLPYAPAAVAAAPVAPAQPPGYVAPISVAPAQPAYQYP
mmetsp:Transcript_11720/g.30079  ORF Transcript_11720/g.30079 Transcript_11720/m.30079 type:complete len:182 (-) Transcript_11720:116-661(-)